MGDPASGVLSLMLGMLGFRAPDRSVLTVSFSAALRIFKIWGFGSKGPGPRPVVPGVYGPELGLCTDQGQTKLLFLMFGAVAGGPT